MTKAKSVAQRRKSRGRPKLEGIREPNGRLSRTGIVHEPADLVAVAARMRRFGLTEKEARSQEAENVIGRLSMLGPVDGISLQQLRAAERFQQAHANWLKAIAAPGAYYEAVVGSGGDEEGLAKWCRASIELMGDLGRAMSEAQRNAWPEDLSGALQRVVIEDREPGKEIGALRLALNAVVHYFGLERVAA